MDYLDGYKDLLSWIKHNKRFFDEKNAKQIFKKVLVNFMDKVDKKLTELVVLFYFQKIVKSVVVYYIK